MPVGTNVLDNGNRTENPLSDSGKWTTAIFPGDATLAANGTVITTDNGSGWSSSFRNDVNYGPDVEVFAAPNHVDTFELHARLQTPGTSGVDGYFLDITAGNQWSIWKVVNNSQTQIGSSVDSAWAIADPLLFEVTGTTTTTLKGYQFTGGSWVQVISVTDSSSPITAAGRIGLALESGATAENFGGQTIGGTDATVTSGVADGIGDVVSPAASAGSTVVAPPADGTGDVPPTNQQISAVVNTGPAVGSAGAEHGGGIPIPTVSTAGDAQVDAPTSDASGDVPTPGASAGSSVTGNPADAAGDIVDPTAQAGSNVGVPVVDAIGDVVTPSLAGDQQIDTQTGDGTGDVLAPVISASSSVSSPPADASGGMLESVISASGKILPRIDLPTTVRLSNYHQVVVIESNASSTIMLDQPSSVTIRNTVTEMLIDG